MHAEDDFGYGTPVLEHFTDNQTDSIDTLSSSV